MTDYLNNQKYYVPKHPGTDDEASVCYRYYIGDRMVAAFIDDKEYQAWYDFNVGACGSSLSDVNGSFKAGEFDTIIQSYKEMGPEYELKVIDFRLPEDTSLSDWAKQQGLTDLERSYIDAIKGIWRAMYAWLTDVEPAEDQEFYALMVHTATGYWDIEMGHGQ